MINNKDGHIPSPRIMFTCTWLRHALLEWQKNTGVHPKDSQSKLKVDRPDRLNYFNQKNDGCNIAFCCAVMGRKLLTPPGVPNMCTFLMNTWNTLPESQQQMVNYNALATVKRPIQQSENTIHAVVISMEAARIENAILLHYLASEVALEESELRSSGPNILIENNRTNDKLHFQMPVGTGDYKDTGDESDHRVAIPAGSQ